jgi:hypothetical protein
MAAKKKRAKKTKAVRRARKTTRARSKRNLTKRRSAKKAIKRKIKKKSASRQRPTAPRRATRRTVRSGEQSGDLQGISAKARADSESVDELLEEGNAFEADVVNGVQDAGNNQGQEVQTHEVPEDDVPGEYLDEQ